MAIVLPILSFLILSRFLGKVVFNSRREACLVAAVTCCGWVWATSEVLSLLGSLNFMAITSVWAVFLAGAIILTLKEKSIHQKASLTCLPLVPLDMAIAVSIFLIFVSTLLLAFVSPPNTWDALTYHMSRVAHWAQNGTLAPYPTHIQRQIFSNPGFEYFILHFYVLAGSDAFVCVVQWLGQAGSLMVVTLIAKQLGAPRRGQLLAAMVAATIPMGIVEASSLQGDYVVAFFLCASVYALLRWRLEASWIWAVVLGVTAGLGILAKGTGIFFMLPVLIWLVSAGFFRQSCKRWQQVLVVLSLVGVINAGFIFRTVSAFSSKDLIVATQEGRGVFNESFGPDIFLVNVLRNVATHIGTPSERVNKAVTGKIRSFSNMMGVNCDDPHTTYGGVFKVNKLTRDENQTSAGIHGLLIVIFLVVALFFRERTLDIRRLAWVLISMAVIFCLAVKWQPWLSRLQLPFFVLASAGVGVLLGRVRFSLLTVMIVSVLVIFSIPYIINSYPRHLAGKKNVFSRTREEQYFSMAQARYVNYANVADRLAASGCQDIGLVTGGDDWEYPIWPLLKSRGLSKMRLEHIEVKGALAQIPYPLGKFHPCARVVVADEVLDVVFLKNRRDYASRD